jgi:glycosyltransferase involved in cell wall biosynthesis
MLISYIIPHCNRLELLEYNLRSLLAQTASNFEVVIVDNSDSDTWNKLVAIIKTYKNLNMSIKCYRVNQLSSKFSHDPKLFNGKYNPALNQNIGVKKATGEIVVLTSPEVINASTNLYQITSTFSDDKSKFILGWVREQHKELIVKDSLSVNEIFSLGPFLDGATCIPEQWNPQSYFTGCLRKTDFIKVGGIEERFMAGIGYDDTLFVHMLQKNNIDIALNISIAGIHLRHSRDYQQLNANPNYGICYRLIASGDVVSNKDHEWGSDIHILEAIE